MFNLRSVDVDVKAETAWVQSGATLGELYYAIAEKSKTLAFPGGLCATVGVGGQLGGGGYGALLRKYGIGDEDKSTYKAKSDYVKEPISITGLKGIWKRLLEEEKPVMVFVPYGGRMEEISESEIPFPHRKGNKFMIQYLVYWNEPGDTKGAAHHIKWLRNLYAYMEQYISKNPRTAYIGPVW
ncbi:berberine bridge enzyme-like 15 [Papaver somniferum]|uniref:berberine bridge enzyme-like 15 n=1 Tax=Papaver somniferum TaxID=3469 RepID=UPI000E6F8048|nr:berberine bridge enzyme-like 15 [Papaver somniferum]